MSYHKVSFSFFFVCGWNDAVIDAVVFFFGLYLMNILSSAFRSLHDIKFLDNAELSFCKLMLNILTIIRNSSMYSWSRRL